MKNNHTHLKILFVTNMYPHKEKPEWGAFVMQQAVKLRQLCHHVDVLHILGYRSKLEYLKGALRVFFVTFFNKYDILHVHYGLTGIAGIFKWRLPMVLTLHGSDVLIGKIEPFISMCMSYFADVVIVVCRTIYYVIGGMILPCGVDLDLFKPVNKTLARNHLNLNQKSRLILFPFDPDRKTKRYDIAKACQERLLSKGYQCELIVICNVKNELMPWYYNAADVMILCSDSEGSPTSIKEALACNTPVVSTDVGDVRDIMKGVKGTAVCRQNVHLLSSEIEKIFCNNASSICDGRGYMKKYDQKDTVESIVKVYKKVLKKSSNKAYLKQ